MGKKEEIKKYVASRISLLSSGSPWASAELAKLRRCAGKRLEESPEAWELLFSDMPEDISPRSGGFEPTSAEKAVFVAVTLYSIHQQGEEGSMNNPERSLASAIRVLSDNGSDSIRSRFNSALTSQDIEELSHHLRSLVQLVRSNPTPLTLDYVGLAADLYDFQYEESRFKIQMRWAKDFYRTNSLPEKDKEGEQN